MVMKVQYVGAVSNRDPDLMGELRTFFKRYGVETIAIDPAADLNEVLLTKHQIKLILPKLMTASSNRKLFKKLRQTNLQFLNSLKAVNLCQSRRKMFAYLKKRVPEAATPQMFKKLKGIKKVLKAGRTIWVRRDAHNIPKEERVLGVVNSLGELFDIIQYHTPSELFFQEYYGVKNETYKVYVIGEQIFCLRKIGRQDGFERGPDLITERVRLPDELAEMVLKIGRVFNMSLYGVDYFYHNGDLLIFDINDFPSYRGIPEAVETICEYVTKRYLSG